MATIGSLGVGSGLDLNGLMDKLSMAENVPLVAIEKQQSSSNTKLSAYSALQGLLENFQTAATKLSDPASFSAFKASSSAPDVLGATADTTAVAGTYVVDVTQLAQAQSLVSAGQSSASTAIGSGTVTINFGAISGTLAPGGTYDAGATFSADATRQAILTIDSSNNTLTGIRDAVNKAGIGVTATIVNDGSANPNRLVLTSNATGQKSSLNISVSGDAALKSLLEYDVSTGGQQNLRETVSARDAALTVNGIAVTGAGNTVASAIQGMTLTLAKTGTSTVASTSDTAAVETAVNDFVKAYNNLQGKLTDLTKYDASKKTGAALAGDATARLMQSRLASAIAKEQTGGASDLKSLSSLGISFNTDGTLVVNASQLSSTVASNMAGVAKLFSSAAGSTAGMGKEISALISGFTATDGLLRTATDGLNNALRRLGRDHDDTQARIDAKLARYRTQFQQLDTLVSNMNSTSSYLTQQFSTTSK